MHSRVKRAVLLAVLSIAPVGSVWSKGLPAEPAVACDLLAQEGLRTRGDYRPSGNVYECRSRRRNLVSGGDVNNSIRFVAQGDAEAVTRLTLELQVNSRSAVQRAHRQLVDYSRTLLSNALGADMPDEIEAAILSATSGTWSVAGSSVSLARIVLGGPGYELRFRIE